MHRVRTTTTTITTTTTQGSCRLLALCAGDSLLCLLMSTMAGVGIATGAAKRRRERRLRQWQRHERMTVAMALAEATHHAAPRRQTPVSAIKEVEEQVSHVGLWAQKTPPPGVRPGILTDLPQRSDRSRRHFSACRSSPCRLWRALRARPRTPPLSPSSSLRRWRRRSGRSRRRERTPGRFKRSGDGDAGSSRTSSWPC